MIKSQILSQKSLLNRLNQITYYSRTFSIIPSWDGGKKWTLEVFAEGSTETFLTSTNLVGEFLDILRVFEDLKESLILTHSLQSIDE